MEDRVDYYSDRQKKATLKEYREALEDGNTDLAQRILIANQDLVADFVVVERKLYGPEQ
jgi:hypothetical protein